ncbi:hypothetical protein IRJ14_18830, partial [Isoptericola sp. QY 916]|nr:hypothetical protein [Isoptericola sp. QY 916]
MSRTQPGIVASSTHQRSGTWSGRITTDDGARLDVGGLDGGANAGRWMFKWYGDLEGSQTVQVDPPHPDTV